MPIEPHIHQSTDSPRVKFTDLLEVNEIPSSSLAQGDVFYIDGNNKIQRLGAGTSGNFLKTNGAGANPSWASVNQGATFKGCRAVLSADQTIGNGAVDTALIFQSTDFDTNPTMHSTSSSKITINTAGKYCVMFSGVGTNAANANWQASIMLNGTTKLDYDSKGASPYNMKSHLLYNFAQNDYIEVYVNQNSAGNLAFVTNPSSNSPTFFSAFIYT